MLKHRAAPTTCKWSIISLPTTVWLILEVWGYLSGICLATYKNWLLNDLQGPAITQLMSTKMNDDTASLGHKELIQICLPSDSFHMRLILSVPCHYECWPSLHGSDKVFLSEWVIKFNSLSGDRGHRGPYIPYKLCNHNLYIGIIIFPHIDNAQYTGQNQLYEKIKKRNIKKQTKKWGHPFSWLAIWESNSTSVYSDSKYLTSSLIETEPHTAIANQPDLRRKIAIESI